MEYSAYNLDYVFNIFIHKFWMNDFHTLTGRPILVIFRSTFFGTLFIDFTWFELRYATNEIAMTWFSLSWKRSSQRCVFILLAQIRIVYHSNFSCPWPKNSKKIKKFWFFKKQALIQLATLTFTYQMNRLKNSWSGCFPYRFA